MKKGQYAHSPWWTKVMQWLGVMALLTIVAMGAWMAVPCDHASTGALKWFQFVQTIGTFLLPPFICAWLWSAAPMEWLRLKGNSEVSKSRNIELFICAIMLMIVALPGINLLADWNSRMELPECMAGVEAWMKAQEEAAMALTERFLAGTGVATLVINIGLMALLPAMAEELTFRGVVMGLFNVEQLTFSGKRAHVAVWVTAILFSAIHMQFYGFVPRMLLGALFGYALLWTGSLWGPIVMHFTNNCMTVVAYWIVYSKGINPETVDAFGTGETAWLGWLSIVLAATGIYFFWRRSRQISSASSRISEGS